MSCSTSALGMRSMALLDRGSTRTESPAFSGSSCRGWARWTMRSSSVCPTPAAGRRRAARRRHDLAAVLEVAGGDDVHRLVEQDLLARVQLALLHLGPELDLELAPGGHHDRGAGLLAEREEGAVALRRAGEPLDLVAQARELLAGLPEGLGQLHVLGLRRLQLALGLQQPLLEHPDPGRRALQPPTQQIDLVAEVLDLGRQRVGVLGQQAWPSQSSVSACVAPHDARGRCRPCGGAAVGPPPRVTAPASRW
jgi:hypothetical protein